MNVKFSLLLMTILLLLSCSQPGVKESSGVKLENSEAKILNAASGAGEGAVFSISGNTVYVNAYKPYVYVHLILTGPVNKEGTYIKVDKVGSSEWRWTYDISGTPAGNYTITFKAGNWSGIDDYSILVGQTTATLNFSSSKTLNVSLIYQDQNSLQCGPASLAMVSKFINVNVKNKSTIIADLRSINRYWSSFILITQSNCNNYKPMYNKYVDIGDNLGGTYGDYLVQVANNYYSNTGYSVYNSIGMNLNTLKSSIDSGYPIIVDVWAHNGRIGYTQGAFTHFVVVRGYQTNANGNVSSLYINDPLPNNPGSYWVTAAEFNDAWSGRLAPKAPDKQNKWGMIIRK